MDSSHDEMMNSDKWERKWRGEKDSPKEDKKAITPTLKEYEDCMFLRHLHQHMIEEGDAGSIRFERILKACYPQDKHKQHDLFCALTKGRMDWLKKTGKPTIPLSEMIKIMKYWDVEDVHECSQLQELFRPVIL